MWFAASFSPSVSLLFSRLVLSFPSLTEGYSADTHMDKQGAGIKEMDAADLLSAEERDLDTNSFPSRATQVIHAYMYCMHAGMHADRIKVGGKHLRESWRLTHVA